jgi:hypothetical protein
MAIFAAVAIVAAGCGGASPPSSNDTTVDVLRRTEAQFDDEPGAEAIALFKDGRLTAGNLEGRATLPSPLETYEEHALDAQGRLNGVVLRVVKFGQKNHPRAILVALPTNQDEDPPSLHQLFIAEPNGLRRVLNMYLGQQEPLSFNNDGTAEFVESGSRACARAGQDFTSTATVERQKITLGGLTDESDLREIGRDDTGETQRCDQIPACPYVYVVQGGRPKLVGEILRNQSGPDAYAIQRLSLPLSTGSRSTSAYPKRRRRLPISTRSGCP